MKSAPTWRQNGSQNPEKINRKRGPKIDAKKGSHARTYLVGQRSVAGTILRLIISSRLVFRLVFRLVLASFRVLGRHVTSRGVVFLVMHSFSFHFASSDASCRLADVLHQGIYPVKVSSEMSNVALPAAERSIAKATDASHIVVRRPVSGCEFKGISPTRRPQN